MKKIIAAFDGLKFSESTAQYAIDIAKNYDGKLFGIFLEDFTYHNYGIMDLVGEEAIEQRAAELSKQDARERELSVQTFKKMCESEGLVYAIHRDRNIAIREIISETRFADMIVIQTDETLNHFSEKAPTGFITTLLEKTECPVLLVPPEYKKIERVVFLYDGKVSSVFALKQFSYVLPGLDDVPAELVFVKEKSDQHLPDAAHMKEWLKLNYSDLKYTTISGDPDKEIIHYLQKHAPGTMVVLGAYQRGSISRMLHQSMADKIIHALQMPLFISHR